MTNEEMLDRVSELKEELAGLEHELTERTRPTRERLSHGSFYWYVNRDGSPCRDTDTGHKPDAGAADFGNYFPSRELAEEYAERIRVYNDLMLWADGGPVQFAYFKDVDRVVMPASEEYVGAVLSPFSFSSYRRCGACIDDIGQDRLKKYWFGIQE